MTSGDLNIDLSITFTNILSKCFLTIFPFPSFRLPGAELGGCVCVGGGGSTPLLYQVVEIESLIGALVRENVARDQFLCYRFNRLKLTDTRIHFAFAPALIESRNPKQSSHFHI